jgi:acylphosphatase
LDAEQPPQRRLDYSYLLPNKAYRKCDNATETSAPRAHCLSATIYRFVSESKQARRYFVSGIVQGVGFRYFAQRAAERLHLSGYTKNLPDGRVEVYAIGTAEQLAKLRSILERGPWGASVSEVKEEDAPVDSNYADGFGINY